MEPTTPDSTPRERELQAQVEEQAGQIRRLESRIKGADATNGAMARGLSDIDDVLCKSGKVNAPDQDTVDRVRALIRYVGEVEREGSYYADLCNEAHIALNEVDAPVVGTPADRIRALASRTAPPPDQRLQAIAAELLADLDDVTDAGEAWGIHLVRALRAAVGVGS